MAAEARPSDPLLQQWRELPVGDRKNIMRRLPAEQRLAFQQILAVPEREESEIAARNRRFRAYSPWLGEILDACEKGGPEAASLKPAVRAALLEGHEQESARAEETETPLSFAALVQMLLRSVKELL